ncbi:MAG: BT4734/BF3469 family protein [Verrucomicrobiota bacterium JB024]|nr:BT4734/BF3469 family protein [Verrucomicrobiota bacterium JB024]
MKNPVTSHKIEIGAATNHTAQRSMRKIDLGDALEQIRSGRDYEGHDLQPKIQAIRDLKDGDEERRRLKGQLPVLVFSGFSSSNSREELEAQPNGIICVDIDKIPQGEIDTVRQRLVADEHTLACFLSPSGNGFKVIHRIPDPSASWSDNFKQVEGYYRQVHQLEIDSSCKNANRLCYYSYDPDIYINWEALRLPSVDLTPDQPPVTINKNAETTFYQAAERAHALLEITPEQVGEHAEWIRFCGAVSNYLQGNGHTAEQALEILTRKWGTEEDRQQLKALVKDRRDTPLVAAEALVRSSNPEAWSSYQRRYLDTWPHWKGYVYDSVSDELVDVKSFVGRTRKAFDLKYTNDKPEVRKDDSPVKVSPSLYTIERCPETAGREYAPAEARPVFVHENGERLLNLYRPVQYTKGASADRVEAARELLAGHIHHLFTDEQEAALLLDYLAWCTQNPGVLKSWMIILYGVQGDGKSWFRELMEAALGEANVGVLQSSNLEDQFASPAYGKCLTFIEELKLDNVRKYDTLERLKSLIGNRRVSLREMRRAPREVRATANYLAATNHSDSLPVSDNERRFCVLTSQWVDRKHELREWVHQHPDYYPTLYRMVREEPEALRQALLEHPVSQAFLETYEAPRTRGTIRMIEEAIPSGVVELREWIEEWDGPWINQHFVVLRVLKKKHADESDRDTCFGTGKLQNMPPDKKLREYLSQLGYTKHEKRSIRLKGDGSRKLNVTIYLKPEVDTDAAFAAYRDQTIFQPKPVTETA